MASVPKYAFGPPTPAGGFRAVPARQVPTATVVHGQQTHPGSIDWKHELASRFVPRYDQPQFTSDADVPSVMQQLEAYDPRHLSGVGNLAAMFFRGPKGGARQVGPLTGPQRGLLDSLKNVRGGGPIPSEVQDWLVQIGVSPDAAARMRLPYKFTNNQTSVWVSPRPSQGDLHDIAGLMGVPRGHPFRALEFQAGKHGEGPIISGNEAIPSQMFIADAKLGLAPGELPWWATDKTQKNTAGPYRDTTHGLDQTQDHAAWQANYWNQLSMDQKEQLARIISAIVRRPFGPSGTQQGSLGDPGSN